MNLIENRTKQGRVDEGSGFYNISMKSCLQDTDVEIYSTHNEGKSFV